MAISSNIVAAPAAPVESAAPPVVQAPAPPPTPAVTPAAAPSMPVTASVESRPPNSYLPFVAAFIGLGSVLGFLLYYTGQTRAKNSSHTSTLLLIGIVFALIGYWAGGFAVQTGGVGDAHAVLAQPFPDDQRNALDHELGWTLSGHYWGLMGSAGFFLAEPAEGGHDGVAEFFLMQAALMVIAVGAALGACLERGRLFAYAVGAFVVGVMIYPFFANWVWGGGWLAAVGHEYGLGHGFIDFGGAGVIHESAGILALVIALLLGPRQGRFTGRTVRATMPGHHVPYLVAGAVILFAVWIAVAAVLGDPTREGDARAPLNTLLGGASGLLISIFVAGWRRRRPEPAIICRGLLGGAIATLAGGVLFEPWAAFAIGAMGGLIVFITTGILERLRIDDPSGAVAVHGVAGGWGVLAVGVLANGAIGNGINGVPGSIRGAIYSGHWHQLAAQALGLVTCGVAVFVLGYAFLGLIHKILHSRVDAAEEAEGLDWTETGSFGYQPDAEHLVMTEPTPLPPSPVTPAANPEETTPSEASKTSGSDVEQLKN